MHCVSSVAVILIAMSWNWNLFTITGDKPVTD